MKTMVKTKALLILTLMSPLSLLASEGGNAGGGGKGILCRNENGIEKVYLADTINYVKAGGLKQFQRTTEAESVLKAVAELIELDKPQKIYPHPFRANQKVSLAWMLEYQLQKLGNGIDFQLPDVPDDHIDPMDLPAGCQKVQLAYTDFSTGLMHVNPHFEHQLTWLQRGFLNLHEVLVSLRGAPGQDTTPIRKEVESYAKLLDQKINFVSPMIRHLLLTGHKPGRNAAEEAAIEFADLNKCYSIVHDWLRPDDGLKAKCAAALDLQWQFRSRKYPSLKRLPKELVCKTTGFSKSSADVVEQKAFTFKMIRTTGEGFLPPSGQRDPNVYRMDLESGSHTSKSVHFWVEDKDGHQLTTAFGRFSLGVYFDENIQFHIIDYNERTQLFDGSLSYNGSKWISYNIVCDGGPAEIGM